MMNFNFHLELLGTVNNVFDLFRHFRVDLESEFCFLLESVQEETKETLYSFMCFEPDYVLEIKKGKSKIRSVHSERGEKILEQINSREPINPERQDFLLEDRVKYDIKAFDELDRYVIFNQNTFREIFPRNVFYGGYLGYVGYDCVASWVGFNSRSPYPDVLMGFHSKVLVYNHQNRQLFFIDNTFEGESSYERPEELIKSMRRYEPRQEPNYPKLPISATDGYQSNVTFDEYAEMIEKTKEHVYSGDIIQAVISRKIQTTTTGDDLDIYGALRLLNPSPYMYYLDFGDIRLLGSSPEALVSIDNKKVRTVPIAGTRKRGATPEEEERMIKELTSDPKEQAEHVMLVDLARNDLAKISKVGSVSASTFKAVRKYKHLMHLVTHLEAERRDLSSVEILRSMFPAGTVSGAPKLRAMEIINEVERDSRGPYGGVVGYFSLNGDADLAIAIRTIFRHNDDLTVQAGGGIVKDSIPELEWIETRNKMRSILLSIKMAEALP
ncbi:MAG: anthranilate synthase component I family protein [Candidatus Helarchaeales archaeon]